VTDPAAVGYGTAGLPYLPYIKCVYNASSFYNGSYTAAFGQVRCGRGGGGRGGGNCVVITHA
jgi:hypothetical protein